MNLSHKNIVSNLYGLRNLMSHDASKANVSLCFLPWSHVFGLVREAGREVLLPHPHMAAALSVCVVCVTC